METVEAAHALLFHALHRDGVTLQEHQPEPRTLPTLQEWAGGDDVHSRLRRALTGEPEPVKLAEGVHATLAKALGHDGRVIQEDEPVDRDTIDDPHTILANALRSR